MQRHYITTAIDYPNAAPHMGHVLEKVLADTVARWFRLRGAEVRFQIGTDEHGIKIQRKAEEQGVTPQELVDTNVLLFKELYELLHISADAFIRTSDKQTHYPTVQALWKRLQTANVLEKRSYTGLYCAGCERFLTERDLTDGVCPYHNKPPEEVTEENWFFTMSNDTTNLHALLTSDWDGESYRIVPQFRANETLSLLEQGLEDVSFSRPVTSLQWGVPVPDDEGQTMYVWCDALTNYISGLGYFTEQQQSQWWDDATVTHVIGKDIARFHALIWPAMLKHAEVRLPDQLLIHGFLTNEGEKMSKSLGNVVQPHDVLERFQNNPDPIRFYLSHEITVGRDGDFSWDRFEDLYNSKLRNQLGNLLNRVLTLLQKEGGALGEIRPHNVEERWQVYINAMDSFDLKEAIEQAMAFVQEGNLIMDMQKPWALGTEQKLVTLSMLCECLRHCALMLLPFMPTTAQKISTQLGVPYAVTMLEKDFVLTDEITKWGAIANWNSIGTPEILFAPLD